MPSARRVVTTIPCIGTGFLMKRLSPSISGTNVGAQLTGQWSSEDYSSTAPTTYKTTDGSYKLVCRYSYPTDEQNLGRRADTTYDCTYTAGGSQSLTSDASNTDNECPTIQTDVKPQASQGVDYRKRMERRGTAIHPKQSCLRQSSDGTYWLLNAGIKQGSYTEDGAQTSYEIECLYRTSDTPSGLTCTWTQDMADGGDIVTLTTTEYGWCPSTLFYASTEGTNNMRRSIGGKRDLIWQEPNPYNSRQVNTRSLRTGRNYRNQWIKNLINRGIIEERC
ncbi:uncharacterized protein I206_102363 [Kwoniella pini CBS 10737]|uniref:Uncharacterized protein n=1 Tax=Kwoniella pini CBS 10737 TaxID=1296096 RepID=A0A1B9I555_9TREE|nr:uncharacterized protein I206_02710 [Kwoniella pini CBS 10737]OCF50655.1 hypothetical protein I206_02710 [Kwoniella pini CBS 10737]